MFRDFAASDAEFQAWKAAITRTHERRITVRVLDLNHARVAWIDKVLDGQVTIDTDNRACTRVANLTLLDPSRSIGWEPDSPSSLPLHLRRMIQIFDERRVPGYGWLACPVFTGPVVDIDRSGAEVSLVCEGKERLALGSFGHTREWRKGRKVTDVVRDILEIAGEAPTRIHLPRSNATLPKPLVVTRGDSPWNAARRLAGSIDMDLFYNGRGHAIMRRRPTKDLLTIDQDLLLGPMRLDRPKLDIHNGWIVLGAKPGGDKPRVTSGLIALPASSPFSAQSLARNGKPRWLIHQEERSQVKTNAKAREIALRMRNRLVRYAATVSFDCLPVPNIEEWDLLRVKDPLAGVAVVPVKQATLPLVSGGMTIGAVKRIARVKGIRPAG